LVACDISQIPMQQESWSARAAPALAPSRRSARPTSAEMVQVQELLGLFDKTWINGPIVVTNFIFRRVQPYKDRVHPMYEYSGSADTTQESLEELPSTEIDRRLAQLFDLVGYRLLPNVMRAYKLTSPLHRYVQSHPQFNSMPNSCWFALITLSLIRARPVARTRQRYTSPTCPPMNGQPAWMSRRPMRSADRG
jgi:hypothetical protein